MKLQMFGLEITWVPGRDHIAADCISRAVVEQQEGAGKRGEDDGGHLDGEDAATEQRLDPYKLFEFQHVVKTFKPLS